MSWVGTAPCAQIYAAFQERSVHPYLQPSLAPSPASIVFGLLASAWISENVHFGTDAESAYLATTRHLGEIQWRHAASNDRWIMRSV